MIQATLRRLTLRASSASLSSVSSPPECKTTNERYQDLEKDYRNARFNLSDKYVNPNVAVNLINEIPPIKSSRGVVFCDGGSSTLGHPKVYINLDKPGYHSCGYCGLRFYHEEEHP